MPNDPRMAETIYLVDMTADQANKQKNKKVKIKKEKENGNMNGRDIIPIQLNKWYDTIKLQKTIKVEFNTKLQRHQKSMKPCS